MGIFDLFCNWVPHNWIVYVPKYSEKENKKNQPVPSMCDNLQRRFMIKRTNGFFFNMNLNEKSHINFADSKMSIWVQKGCF